MLQVRSFYYLLAIVIFATGTLSCKKEGAGNPGGTPAGKVTPKPAPKRNPSDIVFKIEDTKRTVVLDQLIYRYGDGERGQFIFKSEDEDKKQTLLLFAKLPRELMSIDDITTATVWSHLGAKPVEILAESSLGKSMVTVPEVGVLNVKTGSAFIIEKFVESPFPNEMRVAGRMQLKIDIGKIPTTISGQFRVYAKPEKME